MKKIVLNAAIVAAVMMIFGLPAIAQNVPNCSGNQLSLKQVEGDNDMGGKVYENFVFTNISSKACTLSGFPAFVLLNKTGKVMSGVRVKYDDSFVGSEDDKPSSVMLEPAQTAWFRIFYSSGMGYDLKRPPASSTRVKITAPKTTRAFFLKDKIGAYKEVWVSFMRGGMPE